jgi:hypothetical protein
MMTNSRQLNRLLQWSRSLRELFYQGKPDEVLQQYRNRPTSLSDLSVQTYCILFKALTMTKNWSEGQQLHTQMKTNIKLYHDQRLKIASSLENEITYFVSFLLDYFKYVCQSGGF